MNRGKGVPDPTERASATGLGAGAAGGPRQTARAPPLTVEARLFTFGSYYLLMQEEGEPYG